MSTEGFSWLVPVDLFDWSLCQHCSHKGITHISAMYIYTHNCCSAGQVVDKWLPGTKWTWRASKEKHNTIYALHGVSCTWANQTLQKHHAVLRTRCVLTYIFTCVLHQNMYLLQELRRTMQSITFTPATVRIHVANSAYREEVGILRHGTKRDHSYWTGGIIETRAAKRARTFT